MKSLIFFEKLAIFEIWQLVSFGGVKIQFGEKYAWFAIEILFMEANLSFGYVMVPKNHQKTSIGTTQTTFSENINY